MYSTGRRVMMSKLSSYEKTGHEVLARTGWSLINNIRRGALHL
jgi:hypothetical protein